MIEPLKKPKDQKTLPVENSDSRQSYGEGRASRPPRSSKPHQFSPTEDAVILAGDNTTANIAKKLGCSLESVRYRAKKLGIKNWFDNRWTLCRYCGKEPRYRRTRCRECYFAYVRTLYAKKREPRLGDKKSMCIECGSAIEVHRLPIPKYCSKRCRERHRWTAWRQHGTSVKCAQCGKEFEKSKPQSRFCSDKCSDSARWDRRLAKQGRARRRPIESRECNHCHKSFKPPRRRYQGKMPQFCSLECAYQARTMAKTPGRFHRWASKAKPIRKRDGGCLACGVTTGILAVDHTIPYRLMKDWGFDPEDVDNLATNCTSCHGKKTVAERALHRGDIAEFVRRLKVMNYPLDRVRVMFTKVGLPTVGL